MLMNIVLHILVIGTTILVLSILWDILMDWIDNLKR
jgi:hypothetical protein